MKKEKRNYRLLLSQKKYLRLIAADVINRFGDSLDVIVYSWIMYEITGSESLMALIMGLNYVPTVLLQPFAGAIVERRQKKSIMVAADLLRCAIVTAIAVLYACGALTPLLIAVFTLCTSTVEAFRLPAGSAIVPQLLHPEYYTLGKAANYTLCRASELVGLTVAGGLIAVVGAHRVLFMDAATFAISAMIILGIRHTEQLKGEALRARRVLADIVEGLAFVKTNSAVQTLCLLGLLINFGLMPLSVFQTPYVYDSLQMGPEMLSLIKILMIVGMMTGAAAAPKLLRVAKGRMAAAAGMAMGVAIVLMEVVTEMETAAAKVMLLTVSMLGVGAGGGILNVMVGGCMMKKVPKGMMARISAMNSAVMQSSMPIGAFICSALALKLSVTRIFRLFGVLTMAAYAALALFHAFDELE